MVAVTWFVFVYVLVEHMCVRVWMDECVCVLIE